MIYNFCTLFDSNYFTRGIALYKSLSNQNINFHLYVFAFDDKCYLNLKNLQLHNLTVISLSEFEDNDLLKVKSERTKAEYCWTSTPSTILYCINNFKIDNCTYLDADLFFYNSPLSLYEEIHNASIAITKHNYTLKYDQSKTSGIYCVQFVYFKNDNNGLKALNWWRNSCLEWCYARLENGKFGDQKYLDDWTSRFENVHVIKNPAAGLAPWNVQQFEIINSDNYLIKEKLSNEIFKTIFFHYHNLNFQLKKNEIIVNASKFDLSEKVINVFYFPYIKLLSESKNLDLNNLKITFLKLSIFGQFVNNLRLLLKKSNFFRKINSTFIKSSR
jgi:hypothetical protein